MFFLVFASIGEATAVIPKGTKIVFAKGTATFVNGPENLLNDDPKIPPDWIILDISALESFISVDIWFSNTFLKIVFCLVVNNNSWGKLFPLNILIFTLKVTPVLFLTTDFSLFNCEFDNLTITLLYSTIYTIHGAFAGLL